MPLVTVRVRAFKMGALADRPGRNPPSCDYAPALRAFCLGARKARAAASTVQGWDNLPTTVSRAKDATRATVGARCQSGVGR